jgi:hypothetical protein
MYASCETPSVSFSRLFPNKRQPPVAQAINLTAQLTLLTHSNDNAPIQAGNRFHSKCTPPLMRAFKPVKRPTSLTSTITKKRLENDTSSSIAMHKCIKNNIDVCANTQLPYHESKPALV